MISRRGFFSALAGVGVMTTTSAGAALQTPAAKVTLLHTNDTHSRIDPFPSGPWKDQGGIAQRAALIARLRRENPATLVADAGDIFQGTPYFNLFKGRVELETMSLASYDIATLGNHDFDLGSAWLLTAIQKYARFSFVSSNLAFSQPSASRLIQPYLIREIQGRRLGFFGLTVQFQGLVPAHLHEGVTYHDPIRAARRMVGLLRHKLRCDAVILLSHLGLTGFAGEPGDVDLAASVEGIDAILGGHTHTFLSTPRLIRDPAGHETPIFQVGHSGLFLGQIDLLFPPKQPPQIQSQGHPVLPPVRR